MTKVEWIKIENYIPEAGISIIVNTPFGIRKAKRPTDIRMMAAYVFTDCTHPLQNIVLLERDIKGWQFENEDDANNLKMTPNHWAREKEGASILNSIKPNFFQKVRSWVKRRNYK